MRILNAFILALILFGVATVTFWLQDRTPPVTILDETVETPTVERRAQLRVRYVIERKKTCQVYLEQMVFDAQRGRFILETQSYLSEPLGRDEFAVVLDVPAQMTTGFARYRATRNYYCNPVQRFLDWPITVTQPDLSFEVVE
jgi:hypothetical protein